MKTRWAKQPKIWTGMNTKQVEMITGSSVALFATMIVLIPFVVFVLRKNKE